MRFSTLIKPVILAVVFFILGCPAFAETVADQGQGSGQSVPDTTAVEQVFTDVPAGSSNILFINYLAGKKILTGYPDGTFRPQSSLTRAQAAVVVCRAIGLRPATGQSFFRDVPDTHWAAGHIYAARTAGFTQGYPDGTFRPEEILTRAEAVTLILSLSKQPDPGVSLLELTDIDSRHWAAGSVAIGLAAGMVDLSADGHKFLPDAPFSREDMAQALGVLLTTDPDFYTVSITSKLEVIKGSASLQRGENLKEYVQGESVELKKGDQIVTGVSCTAKLSFPDGSSLRFDENTRIVFNEARGRSYIRSDGAPGTAVDWLNINLNSGKLHGVLASRFDTEKAPYETVGSETGLKSFTGVAARGWDVPVALLAEASSTGFNQINQQQFPWYQAARAKKVRVKVNMPWGVSGIKGTFWANSVSSSGQSSASVLIGSIEMTSADHTVNLDKGQASQVTSLETPPTTPEPMTAQQKVEFILVKDWIEETARQIENLKEAQITPAPTVDLTELVEEIIKKTEVEVVEYLPSEYIKPLPPPWPPPWLLPWPPLPPPPLPPKN